MGQQVAVEQGEELFGLFLSAKANSKGSFQKMVTDHFESSWTDKLETRFTYDYDKMKNVEKMFETWKQKKNKYYKVHNNQGWRHSKDNLVAAQALNTALGKLGVVTCVTASKIQLAYLKNAKLQPKSTNLQPRTKWGKKVLKKAMTPCDLNSYTSTTFQNVLGIAGVKMDQILEYFSGMILQGMNNVQGQLAEFPLAIGMLIRGIEDTFGASDANAFCGTLTDKVLTKIKQTALKIGVAIKNMLLGPFKKIADFCSTAKKVYTLTDQDKTALKGISGSDVVWHAVKKLQVTRIGPIWETFKKGLKEILQMGLKLVTRVALAFASGGFTLGLEAGKDVLDAAYAGVVAQLPKIAEHIKSIVATDVAKFVKSEVIDANDIKLPQSFDGAMEKLEGVLAKGAIIINKGEMQSLNTKFRLLTQNNVHEVMTNPLIASYFVCNHSNKELTEIDLTAKQKFRTDIETSLGQLRQFAKNYINGSDYELVPGYSYAKPNIDAQNPWPTFNRPCPPLPVLERQPSPSIKPPKSDASVAAKAEYTGTYLTLKNLFRDGSTGKLDNYSLIKTQQESIGRQVFITNSYAFGISGRSALTDSIDTSIKEYHSQTFVAKARKGTDSYLDSLHDRVINLEKLIGLEQEYFAGRRHSKKHGRGFKFRQLGRVLRSELEFVLTEQERMFRTKHVGAMKSSITSIPIVRRNRDIVARNNKKKADHAVSVKQWEKERDAHEAFLVKAKEVQRKRFMKRGLISWAEHVSDIKDATWGAGKLENHLTIPITPDDKKFMTEAIAARNHGRN